VGSAHQHFADAVVLQTRRLWHPLCVGLDPYLDRIPAVFRRGSMTVDAPETGNAVEEFLVAALDRLADKVAVVKPQIALFEQLGWRGLRILESVVQHARQRGLLVLLDAKRGDIGATADGYARAYLDPASSLAVDAMTVNPYLGLDALEPFVSVAEKAHKGVIVLVRNSNPGAGRFQELKIGEQFFYEVVAQSLQSIERRLAAPETHWSSLGVTVAATAPEASERIRLVLPRALFLVLGYGAQGGSARDAVRGFVRGPHGLEGGMVNASHSVLFPKAGDTADAAGWEKAFDAAVQSAVAELQTVVHG